MSQTIKALLIDDERGARNEIKRMLAEFPRIEVIGEAENASQVAVLIQSLQPELLFLDIQMPGKTGFDLLEDLQSIPEVIFVTAYDEYALQAFDVSAMDYLMKPIRLERFQQAMEKVINRFASENESRLFVKDRGRYFRIAWSEIRLIESMDNYSKLYFGSQSVLIKSSLKKLEEHPSCADFFRASRTQMFNRNYVKEVIQKGNILEIKLSTGECVSLSERKSVLFKALQKE